MMKISPTKVFKRDYKKYKKKHYDMNKLEEAIRMIVEEKEDILATQYKDHALTGNWKGYRELHLEGDWLLIYKVNREKLILTLIRTGSHDDLF